VKRHPDQFNLFAGATPTSAYDSLVEQIPKDVCELFERFTFQVINTGRSHYSSDAILHRIRWHAHIEQHDDDFKCNDHWTSALSRWFMERHPQHTGFFETRRLRKDTAPDLT